MHTPHKTTFNVLAGSQYSFPIRNALRTQFFFFCHSYGQRQFARFIVSLILSNVPHSMRIRAFASELTTNTIMLICQLDHDVSPSGGVSSPLLFERRIWV
jgi:hypothetical protein